MNAGSKADLNDIVGKKYGHVTVLRHAPEKDYHNSKNHFIRMYEVTCDCVEHPVWYVKRSSLTDGGTTSCGCGRGRKVADKLIEEHARFGKLTVVALAPRKRVVLSSGEEFRITQVYCNCDCGTTNLILPVNRLLTGNTTSCGCRSIEATRESNSTHRLTHHRLYHIYNKMIERCYNPNNKQYRYYGGKGIRICRRWYDPTKTKEQRRAESNQEFLNFYNDAYANGYYDQPKDTPLSDRLSIDRIKVWMDYSPETTRWIPFGLQSSNTSHNREIVDIDGESLIYARFDDKYGLPTGETSKRFTRKWAEYQIIYSAHHYKEFQLHKDGGKKSARGGSDMFRDSDGFIRLMPKPGNPLYLKNEDGKYSKKPPEP